MCVLGEGGAPTLASIVGELQRCPQQTPHVHVLASCNTNSTCPLVMACLLHPASLQHSMHLCIWLCSGKISFYFTVGLLTIDGMMGDPHMLALPTQQLCMLAPATYVVHAHIYMACLCHPGSLQHNMHLTILLDWCGIYIPFMGKGLFGVFRGVVWFFLVGSVFWCAVLGFLVRFCGWVFGPDFVFRIIQVFWCQVFGLGFVFGVIQIFGCWFFHVGLFFCCMGFWVGLSGWVFGPGVVFELLQVFGARFLGHVLFLM